MAEEEPEKGIEVEYSVCAFLLRVLWSYVYVLVLSPEPLQAPTETYAPASPFFPPSFPLFPLFPLQMPSFPFFFGQGIE